MMGIQNGQKELFSYGVDLEKRVRADNPLRRIRESIDFTFVRREVKDLYGYNGNESVDPAVIMKMMFLLFYEDVPSERELMRVIPERLDWLWFLGYGLDDATPTHSVLSKARKRWGVEVFATFFVRVLSQCVNAGLVSGEKIHVDGSLVDANASKNSVVKSCPELIEALKVTYLEQEQKLELEPEPEDPPKKRKKYYDPKNRGMFSTTDPEAPVVHQGRKDPRPRYKAHRVVDDKLGVITALETTRGDVEENGKLMDLVGQHELNTAKQVQTVVADSQYGTAENFRACAQRGIRSHMADMQKPQLEKGRREGIFGYEDFRYEPETDTYVCPAGERMSRRKHKRMVQAYEYACSRKVCVMCTIRHRCTRAEHGAPRTIKRHYAQELIDAARAQSHSAAARKDRLRRKWLMEGSFADAQNNHGFKRARWRRLWRQQIQDYLIATIQNIRLMIRHSGAPRWETPSMPACLSASTKNGIMFFRSLRDFVKTVPMLDKQAFSWVTC
jgi:transposase